MAKQFNILILGASYGSLLGSKLLMAGHRVSLVCRSKTAQLINEEGTRVLMAVKGRTGMVEIDSRKYPGALNAKTPSQVHVSEYDLVCLAMQEPQYSDPEVRHLMQAIAQAKVPCMSIMNMPPLPFLARIEGIDTASCRPCYLDPAVWDGFEPGVMTLCSPDPQAFRPPEDKVNVLQVRLPTNFKAARFDADAHTQILRDLAADIEAARFDLNGEKLELPVKLKVHDSIFVPLAKWSMLIAGNYRCVQKDAARSIKEAVHTDIEATRAVYNWVKTLCIGLGAEEKDLVPFEKYAAAAQSLVTPSSAARALFAGAPNIERVDRLVKTIAAQKGEKSAVLDETSALVDARLEINRKKV
jgi:hypothetical protein